MSRKKAAPTTPLFAEAEGLKPLAERMRPRTLDEIVGQTRLLDSGKPLGGKGSPIGKCSTTRRTDVSILTPSLSKRSRNVLIWARAQQVPRACSRNSCINT